MDRKRHEILHQFDELFDAEIHRRLEAADRNLNAVAFGHADLLRTGELSPSTLSAQIREDVCKK